MNSCIDSKGVVENDTNTVTVASEDRGGNAAPDKITAEEPKPDPSDPSTAPSMLEQDSKTPSAPIVNRQLSDAQGSSTQGKLYLLASGHESMDKPDEWPDRDEALGIRNQHADKGGQINSISVGGLSAVWKIVVDDLVSHTPLVQDERVYFADWGGRVYAADSRSGELMWQSELSTPQRTWPWHGFAGTGVLVEDRLYEASVEGDLFAIDQQTGNLIWQKRFVEQENAGNLSDLLYYDGLIYIGVQSVSEGLDAGFEDFEPIFRGNVVAIDAKTGDIAWRTYMVEPPQNGAAVWSSFALDPTLNAIYFTTSNNYTGQASLTSDAIISLDAKTGEFRWAQQTTPGDVWTPAVPIGADYGYGAGAQLVEATIDGRRRALVASGQKSGYFHVFDRDTGDHVWSAFIGFGQIGGGIRGEASIGGDRIYIWSNNSYIGVNPPEDFPMSVRALDAATGRNIWFYDRAQPAGGTAAGFLMNDVYFVGSLEGTIHAYNASTGEILWVDKVPGAIASSITVHNDMLYAGTGVPRIFGGSTDSRAIVAFRLTE